MLQLESTLDLLMPKLRKKLKTKALKGARGQNLPLSRRIDHTLLKPDSTLSDILAACSEARKHHFASVCVHSHWLPEVTKALKGSKTLPITVVGFPHGANLAEAKAAETRLAIRQGAREIDMVLNIGRLKSGDWEAVARDIQAVVRAAGSVPVKVILETALLTEREKVVGALLSEMAGAAFVKTSTGFASRGATIEDVALLRRVVGSKMKIKASGGIRSREFADELIAAGADRLGTSSSVELVSASPQAGSKPQKGPKKARSEY